MLNSYLFYLTDPLSETSLSVQTARSNIFLHLQRQSKRHYKVRTPVTKKLKLKLKYDKCEIVSHINSFIVLVEKMCRENGARKI